MDREVFGLGRPIASVMQPTQSILGTHATDVTQRVATGTSCPRTDALSACRRDTQFRMSGRFSRPLLVR